MREWGHGEPRRRNRGRSLNRSEDPRLLPFFPNRGFGEGGEDMGGSNVEWKEWTQARGEGLSFPSGRFRVKEVESGSKNRNRKSHLSCST